MNRPSLGKSVSAWPEAAVWERIHMDWGYVKDHGNIFVINDAGSGWQGAFPAGNRTSETFKVYLSQIFARFEIPKKLAAIADFHLCEPILFKANEKTKTVPATFIIRKGSKKSFIQPENSTRTILVSDNQTARLDEDNVKTEPAVEETIFQLEQQLQNTDV